MDFDERLQKAIQRGQRVSDSRVQASQSKALTEEELKRLHGRYQLQLSEHIEACLSKVAAHFPGFRYETVVGEQGWGAAVYRDDFGKATAGGRSNLYSRLQMTVRPFAAHHVLELAAKATIRNKEAFHRNHFQPLTEVDLEHFIELVDAWALEYAELYSARS